MASILRWSLCLVLALAACQPLYGGKPQKLKNPEPHKPPPGTEVAEPVRYVEECNADFRADPGRYRAQPQIARPLFEAGEAAMSTAEREKDDQKKVALVREAIDKYRNALIKDNFYVEATLKLAVAYDRARRKGCAIAMLKRLAALSANTRMAAEANRNIDAIDSNGQWFRDYRKEAMAAVGR
jgi:hypothetical protein